jgi:hypothetical protein
MPRTILTATAVWALAIGSLTACATANHQPTTSPTPTAPASSTPTTAGASSTPAVKSYTKADLNAAMLTRSDLPTGYTVDPKQQANVDTMVSGCDDEALALQSYRADAVAKAAVYFSNPSGQSVIQSLTLLSGDVANNTLAALKKALAHCTTWNYDKTTFTMGKADYGPYGDESLSYRITVNSNGGIPYVMDVVFMRKANIFGVVMVASTGSGTPQDARAISNKAAGKLPKR